MDRSRIDRSRQNHWQARATRQGTTSADERYGDGCEADNKFNHQ
jgi:hypothetical protein